MAKVITYECNQCGCEITVSESHESHLMPIYCCGVQVSRVSAPLKKAAAAKKKPAKVPKKTVKKIAAKKSAGGATQKKKGPVRKRTSKK